MNQRTADANDVPEPPKINLRDGFTRAPPVLQAYIVFVVCYLAFSVVAFVIPPIGRKVVPFTGWGVGILYGFTISIAVSTTTLTLPYRRKSIYGIQSGLVFFTVLGCLEITRHLVWPNAVRWSGNPYLSIHDFRPIFTVVLPAAWALLFFSPGMRRWVSNPALQNADARWQFSLADLLFVLLVMCVALASALALVTLMHQTAERFARP